MLLNRVRNANRWTWLRRVVRLPSGFEPLARPCDDPCRAVEEPEGLMRALGRLRDREREAIVLVYLDNVAVTEAAALLGLTVAGLASRLHRAIKHLREML